MFNRFMSMVMMVLMCVALIGCSQSNTSSTSIEPIESSDYDSLNLKEVNLYTDNFIEIYRTDVQNRMELENPFMQDLETLLGLGYSDFEKGDDDPFTIFVAKRNGEKIGHTYWYPILYSYKGQPVLVYTAYDGHIRVDDVFNSEVLNSDFIGFIHDKMDPETKEVLANSPNYELVYNTNSYSIEKYYFGSIQNSYTLPENSKYSGYSIGEHGYFFKCHHYVYKFSNDEKKGDYHCEKVAEHVKQIISTNYWLSDKRMHQPLFKMIDDSLKALVDGKLCPIA